MPNGKVLIAGGSYYNGSKWVASSDTQLFDPSNNTFTNGQDMSNRRVNATATLLDNGYVLIAGGQEEDAAGVFNPVSSADLFDANGVKVGTVAMDAARASHTATLLPDGRVLVMGGWSPGGPSVAEIYDPDAGAHGDFAWIPGPINDWPSQHTATLITAGPRAGQVLIAGGSGTNYYYYDPASGFSIAPTPGQRLDHAAVSLPNGRILLIGGATDFTYQNDTASVAMWDPMTGNITHLGNLMTDRQYVEAQIVSTPNGLRVLVTGGGGSSMHTSPRSVELFDPGNAMGAFVAAAPMTQARRSHVAVQLNTGSVLLAGSDQLNVPGAELYNPATNTTTATGSLGTARCYGCAYVKLPDGKVLVTGGWNGGAVFNSGELYNPATGTFAATIGNMTAPRVEHSAVLLNNGKVLILGGYDGTTPYTSAELYDPATQTFTSTGSMAAARYRATVVKLLDGKVLITGGLYGATNDTIVTSSEIYDPVAGSFSPTGIMVTPRLSPAVLLDDGRVLFTGGWSGTAAQQSAEVFSPATGTFSPLGSMTSVRNGHFVVKLASGAVVIGGGHDGVMNIDTAEMFNAATNTFSRISNLPAARGSATAILLNDGRIMITGGSAGGVRIDRVDYYVP
jgi:large repetitive protein